MQKRGTRDWLENWGFSSTLTNALSKRFMLHRSVTGEQVKNGLRRCVLAALLSENIHLQVLEQLLDRKGFLLGLEAIGW